MGPSRVLVPAGPQEAQLMADRRSADDIAKANLASEVAVIKSFLRSWQREADLGRSLGIDAFLLRLPRGRGRSQEPAQALRTERVLSFHREGVWAQSPEGRPHRALPSEADAGAPGPGGGGRQVE